MREYQTPREIENAAHFAKRIPFVKSSNAHDIRFIERVAMSNRSLLSELGTIHDAFLRCSFENRGKLWGDLEADLRRCRMLHISLCEMHMQVNSRKQIVSKNVPAVPMLDMDISTNERRRLAQGGKDRI